MASVLKLIDILHVSAGTTGGWKIIDETLCGALGELGVAVERVAMRRPKGGLVGRAGPPFNDVCQAAALAAATTRGLRWMRPRAIIYSSTHAALLQPPRRVPEAVWVDGPIALMRPGLHNAPLRALERLRQRRLDLVLPMSLQHPELLAGPLRARAMVMLQMPVDPYRDEELLPNPIRPSTPFGIMYAGAPGKKGLDIAVEAWRLASPGMPLVITGLGTVEADAFLPGIDAGDVVFLGPVPRAIHRRLVRDATVYVSASRREEYGTSQMEALAEGTPLAAVPSAGAAEPVAIAHRLTPNLVACSVSPQALAEAIRTAVQMPAAQRDEYVRSAHEIMREYSYDAFKRRLVHDVLPLLLG